MITRSHRGMRRSSLILGAVCAVALVASACSSSKSSSSGGGGNSKSDIVVAGIAELTGPYAAGFAPAADGYKAAVQAINAAGGIDGHQLKLTGPFDSQSTTAGGTSAAQQAVSTHPAFVIAGTTSAEVAAIEPVLTQANIPFIDFSAASAGNKPLHYSTNAAPANLVKAILGEALSKSQARPLRIAFAYLNSPSVVPEVAAMKDQAPAANAMVVDTVQTTATQTSFSSQAADLVRSKPDVIVDVDSLTNTILAARELTTAGFKGPIIGSSAVGALAALKKIGLPNMEGWQQSRVASPGDALYKAAQSVGAQDIASQTNYFSSGYGDVYTMALVLKKCGVPCSAQNFQKTAETMGDINVPDDTYFGPIRFSSSSHLGETALQFYKLDPAGNGTTPAGPVQQSQ